MTSSLSDDDSTYERTNVVLQLVLLRGVINGKAGKAAASPKFSDTLTLSQSGGADYAPPLALSHLKIFVITPLLLLL